MRVDKLLKNYPIVNARMKVIDKQLAFLEDDLNVSGISYDSIGSGSGNISDATGNKALSYRAKKEQLLKEKKKYNRINQLITLALTSLTEDEREVIELFYFQNKTWDEVSGRLGKGRSTCCKLRSDAKEKIKKVLKIDGNR